MPKPGDKAPDMTPTAEPIQQEKRPPKEWKGSNDAAPKGGWRRVAGHYDVVNDSFTHEPMIGPRREELISRATSEKCIVRAKRTTDASGNVLFDSAVVERFGAAWPTMFAASIEGRPIRIPIKRTSKKGFGSIRQVVEYIDIDQDGIGPLPVDLACDIVSRYPQFLELDE